MTLDELDMEMFVERLKEAWEGLGVQRNGKILRGLLVSNEARYCGSIIVWAHETLSIDEGVALQALETLEGLGIIKDVGRGWWYELNDS